MTYNFVDTYGAHIMLGPVCVNLYFSGLATEFCCLLHRPYELVLLNIVFTYVGCCKVCRPSAKGGAMWRHCGALWRHCGATWLHLYYIDVFIFILILY